MLAPSYIFKGPLIMLETSHALLLAFGAYPVPHPSPLVIHISFH